ncbi:hypothetical protein [Sphingobacterium litopenaei]|uniref:Lipoprotein n=1 Tax=Sphingobacterium litopenaei TaxID=2763500 RepID=A0ABR7YGD4_9SPHI|nr:hypothetical protein [Sphingobacterium litopenaei]MBD1430382.1 hypothetical protein [Sphingobacterium litopenaei]
MKLTTLLLSFFALISCSSHKFAKESVFVDDVDEYFNPALKVNVWTYMNFYPYQDGGETGVKLNEFYAQDIDVLKKIGLKSRGAKVLFSAIPNSSPQYHLLAVLHQKKLPKTEGFEKKEVGKDQHYLQKDFELGRLDIRQVLIPFEKGKKMLSLVYYISSEEHLNCKFCKLDYLAKINAINLQDTQQKIYRNNWKIAENISEKAMDSEISVPSIIQDVKGKVYLKLFAEYETETGINYFHILDSKHKEEKIKLKLLPNRYFLEYQDEKFRTINRDTIHIKS